MIKLTFNGEKIKFEIIQILHEIRIPAHLKGYKYLSSAIEKVFNNQEYLYNMTKILYPLIARESHTTTARLERAIYHAVRVATQRNKPRIVEIFGEPVFQLKSKLRNAESIALIAELLYLRQGLK